MLNICYELDIVLNAKSNMVSRKRLPSFWRT